MCVGRGTDLLHAARFEAVAIQQIVAILLYHGHKIGEKKNDREEKMNVKREK
jgi:hypothetical protein